MANALVIYRNEIKTNSWVRWMVNRIKTQNKNNLISIVGKTGSGKTYSAISICEIMSKMDGVPFNIEHVVFSLRELMDLINSETLRKGSKIVFDEPQVSISAREFQSQANKVFNYLLSTFRHKNLSLFFCTPFETLLDKNTRRLFHGRFETLSINKNTNTCRLKPRFQEYSDWKAEPYRKQLIVLHRVGHKMKIRKVFHWDVPKPSKEMIKKYERKKLEFTDNLNRNISTRLQKYDESGKSMTAPLVRKPLTKKQEEVMRVLAQIKSGDKLGQASEIIGIYPSAIYGQRALAMKKGYTVEEFVENDE